MNRSSFTTSPDNRYFEDYVAGAVHEFGSISVEKQEILDFGKRFVPLSYPYGPGTGEEEYLRRLNCQWMAYSRAHDAALHG